MDEYPITHPPLPKSEFDRIADKHKSHDAILLLREIERLRAFETSALHMLTFTPSGGRFRLPNGKHSAQ